MSANEKMSRHEQRVAAFQMIFERMFHDADYKDKFDELCDERGFSQYPYIREAYFGALESANESKSLIGEYAKGWSFDRLSFTAKALLELSVYELLHTDTPPKVVINEAVEISKEFASGDEPSFVNGILNSIARDKGLITAGNSGER